MKSIFEGFDVSKPDEIKKVGLNFCICISPHLFFLDQRKLASFGYDFQVFQFKDVHHFKEALDQMTDEEKAKIHLFYTHEHDPDGDTDVVDQVGGILKENRINYPDTVRVSIAGINVDYRNSIPWGSINNRKKGLRSNYDMAIYYGQMNEPGYWHLNRANNRAALTFLEGLSKSFHAQLNDMTKLEFIALIDI